jgi:protease-4
MGRRGRRALSLAYWTVSETLLRLFGRRKPYSVLRLALNGEIDEEHSGAPFVGSRSSGHDFVELLTLLRWAREDPSLQAVFLHCNHLRAGWAQIQELRRQIQRLRDAGKKVWAYLPGGGMHEYVLASAADRIILPPAATLEIAGLASEVTFWAGALEKLGIEAELVQLGKFKSAGEAFTRTDMSPPHREMIEALLDDLYAQIIDRIAQGRGLEKEEVRRLVDGGPFVATEAVEHGLADVLQYADEAEEELRHVCGGNDVIAAGAYMVRRRRSVRLKAARGARASLALVHVTGAIKSGESIAGPAIAHACGAASMTRVMKQVRERDDIAAVVVRVSSPGGSGFASDLIWHAVARVRSEKPVVVSFGDVAASGGYYVGVAGHPVLAEEGTITGSIGVLAGKAVMRGLYDQLGIHKEVLTRGRHAGMYSEVLPLSGEERERLSTQAQWMYDRFVDVVAGGRTLSRDAVAAAAEGRVWTGRQAEHLGLIDEVGGLEEALDRAKAACGIAPDELVFVERYPQPVRWWRGVWRRPSAAEVGGLGSWVQFLTAERIWAVMPFRIRFF